MTTPAFTQAQFDGRLSIFLAHSQDLHDAWMNQIAPAQPKKRITVSVGRRFIAVWVAERYDETVRSIYAFVDRGNGDLYMPKSWRGPAPRVRGNLFEPDNGFHAMGPHGVS